MSMSKAKTKDIDGTKHGKESLNRLRIFSLQSQLNNIKGGNSKYAGLDDAFNVLYGHYKNLIDDMHRLKQEPALLKKTIKQMQDNAVGYSNKIDQLHAEMEAITRSHGTIIYSLTRKMGSLKTNLVISLIFNVGLIIGIIYL